VSTPGVSRFGAGFDGRQPCLLDYAAGLLRYAVPKQRSAPVSQVRGDPVPTISLYGLHCPAGRLVRWGGRPPVARAVACRAV